MKKIFFVFALLATTLVALAQETDETVIELMNGSIIRGELIDVGDGQRLYIKTANGSVIYFTRRAVKEIGSQKVLPTVRNFRNPVTVYLRNGSIITGQLTELQEGGEMKIETPNRSIVYFTERTLKEVVSGEKPTQRARPTQPDQQIASSDRQTTSREQTSRQASRTTQTQAATKAAEQEPLLLEEPLIKTSGYKGFFDAGYTIKMGDLSANRIEISTSHGYQVNPSLFVGLGLGAHLYSDGFYGKKEWRKDVLDGTLDSINISTAIPIFADVRYNFMEEGQLIPFAGLKAGYTMGLAKSENEGLNESGQTVKKTETKLEGIGFYIAPSIGAKYVISPSFAINFSLGYTMQMFDYSYKNESNNIVTASKNNGGISIKIGVEF